MNHLRPRLQALAQRVPEGTALVDVGSDHAYLPITLRQTNRIRQGIAADISAACIQRAWDNAREAGVTGFDARVGDGLAPVQPEEAETIVIAGMGGDTMRHILENALWALDGRTLLLQPQSQAPQLKTWLYAMGCRVQEEWVVRDAGRLYVCWMLRGGFAPEKLPLIDAVAGEALRRKTDEDTRAYLAQLARYYQEKLRGAQQAGDAEQQGQWQALLAELGE